MIFKSLSLLRHLRGAEVGCAQAARAAGLHRDAAHGSSSRTAPACARLEAERDPEGSERGAAVDGRE